MIEVQEKELAPADDELAKNVGDFEDLAALRGALEHRIGHEKESARSDQRRKSLLDQLIERHPLEVQSQLEDYARGLTARGVELENAPVDWVALSEQAKPAAKQRVHARLILDAMAAADQIVVSAEELESTVATLASSQGHSPVAMRQALDRDGRLSALRQQLRREKTVKHLLGEEEPASETDKEATSTEAQTPTAESPVGDDAD